MIQMDIHKHGLSWRCRFKDPRGIERKFRLARSKRVAKSMAVKVSLLVEHVHAQSPLPDDLVAFVLSLDEARQKQLAVWGVIDKQKLILGSPLSNQIAQWEQAILNRGRAEEYARVQRRRVACVFSVAGFLIWQDIDAERVMQVLEDWRAVGKVPGSNRKTTVSEATLTHYLKACKNFTKWTVRSGSATKDPLIVLSAETRRASTSAKSSNAAQRRALTGPEQSALLSAAMDGPRRKGMSGADRALVYHTALRTGLRSSAIYRLKAKDVDPSGRLMASSGGARNKRTTPKPLRGLLLQELVDHAQTRLPEAPLFDLPHRTGLAKMLQADAKDAGIDLTGVDFHCLRHTFCTEVGRVVSSVKTAMRMMDHSSLEMTMRYMHSWPEDEADAMERMPEIKANATNERMMG